MADTTPTGGSARPILDPKRNLVKDPTFDHVLESKRKAADHSPVALLQMPSREPLPWSEFWAVSGSDQGNNIELLGAGWFDLADAQTPYSVGWPRDDKGNKIHYAMNLNGAYHYGELTQKITLHKGVVNLNFLAVRNNFDNCGYKNGEYQVKLTPVGGGSGLTHGVLDEGRGAGNPKGPKGRWLRHSYDFSIAEAGAYYLTIEGVREDPIATTCGSFVTDIFLSYRLIPHVSHVERAEGHAPDQYIRAKAEQYFASVDFLLYDQAEGALMRNYEVTLEIRDPAASGIHFEYSDKRVYHGRTNDDAILQLPEHLLRAGAKQGTSGQLIVLVDDTEVYKLGLRVEAPAVIKGVAESLGSLESDYLSGNNQHARSQVRFSRALTVKVLDIDHQKATTGEVTFEVTSVGASALAYLSPGQEDWSSVSKTARAKLDVTVHDGLAHVWLTGQNGGASSATVNVTAKVKGKSATAMTFTEHVWPTPTGLVIEKTLGDGQNVLPGTPLSSLQAKLAVGVGGAGVAGEWLRWTIDSVKALKFVPDARALLVQWEDEHHVWVCTDSSGIAKAPTLARVGNETGDAHVTVSSSLAQHAVFTLHFPAATQYVMRMDNDAQLPLKTAQHRTVSVTDAKTGLGVPDVMVRADVNTNDNDAGVTPLNQTATTNSEGEARFTFSAAHARSSQVIFATTQAKSLFVRLYATSHVIKEILSVLTPPLTVQPSQITKSKPITIRLSPMNEDITQIEYRVTPPKDEGLMLRSQDQEWSTHGTLPMVDGQTIVKELRVGDDATPEYKITFSVPGRAHTIHPIDFTVGVERGAVALHVYPENTSPDRPFDLVSGAKIAHDLNLRVIAYRDSVEKIVAPRVSLSFALVMPENASLGSVAFVDGGLNAEGMTDGEGECFVPAMKIQTGFTGAFNIAISNKGSGTPLAFVYFVVKQAAEPKVIEFVDVYPKLRTSHAYSDGIGEVRVYADDGKQQPVSSRVVRFSIATSPANTGASFQAPNGHYTDANGDPVLTQTATLSAAGTAQIPAIKTKHAGTLTLIAIVDGTKVSTSHAFKVE